MKKFLLIAVLMCLATPVFAGGSETVENDVVVVRGGNTTLSETVENGVNVIRGTSDYPVYKTEVVEEKPESVSNQFTEFFAAYDLWQRQVIHRQLYPRP